MGRGELQPLAYADFAIIGMAAASVEIIQSQTSFTTSQWPYLISQRDREHGLGDWPSNHCYLLRSNGLRAEHYKWVNLHIHSLIIFPQKLAVYFLYVWVWLFHLPFMCLGRGFLVQAFSPIYANKSNSSMDFLSFAECHRWVAAILSFLFECYTTTRLQLSGKLFCECSWRKHSRRLAPMGFKGWQCRVGWLQRWCPPFSELELWCFWTFHHLKYTFRLGWT